ncbi:MAG: hypothetical protein KF746_02115 [Chitinophagaceae bacterium]|nr:hypothetical protein [Chitinophagaceae bacterium]
MKLTTEVISAALELENSLSDLEKLQKAIKDIEDGKTPIIAQNEWSDLAYK